MPGMAAALLLPLVLLAASLASAPALAAAPTAGGAGHSLWFDHTRNDVLGIEWATESLSALTIEFWMRVVDPHLSSQAVVAISEYDASVSPIYDSPDGVQLRFRSGDARFYRSSNVECEELACQVLGETGWVHFAVTWDSASGDTVFYRDGVQAHAALGSTGRFASPLTANGCFLLGHEPDEFCGLFDEGQAFDGLIDEFRVWSVVRTPAEIAAGRLAAADPAHPDLNVYYDFNSPAGDATEVADRSGHGNTGLRGRLPSLRQGMTYATARGTVTPTRPVYVASSAPPVGAGGVEARVPAAGGAVEIELPAADEDGDALTVTITSAPSRGTLRQTAAGGGAAIAGGGTVVHAGAQTKAVEYVATTLAAGEEDTFEYTVSDGSGSASATVTVRLAEASAPPARAVALSEDERAVVALGGVNEDGTALQTWITRVPSRGTLYQASFDGGTSYGSAAAAAPIAANGTLVDGARGVVVFVPDTNEFSPDGEAYTDFEYEWRHAEHAGVVSAAPATVTVSVASANDAPSSLPANVTLPGGASGETHVLALGAADPDSNFSPRAFFTVTRFPRFGTLLQVDDATGEPAAGAEPLTAKVEPPTVVAWGAEVLNASSQYSRCDNPGGCRVPWLLPCGDCELTDYHATEVLGEPDVFPAYRDSPRAWSFNGASDAGEFLVLRFPNPVYVSAVELYETLVPGAVVRVSAALSGWAGSSDATEWTTLWSGDVEFTAEEARVFSPPVCEFAAASDVIRFDMASDLRPGYNEFDAVKLVGTLELPRGRVLSASGRVAYEPLPGVHPAATSGAAGSAAYDELEFVANDCEDESDEAGVVRFELASPDPADTAAAAALPDWVAVDTPAAVGEETLVAFDTDAVFDDLRARGVDVSAADEAAAEVLLVAVTTAASGYDLAAGDDESAGGDGGGLKARVPGGAAVTADSLPVSLPAGQVAVTQQLRQGSTRLVAWVTAAGYTYRVAAVTSVSCPVRYHPDAGTGACVECLLVPAAEIEAMTEGERVVFDSRCPDRLSRSYALRVGMSGVAAAVCAATLAMLAAVVRYRRHPVIRYSSPVFCGIILVGCLAGAAGVFVMQAEPSAATCAALPWVLHLSFVTAFSSLFAKTYRLSVVFNNERLRNVRITDVSLFAKVVGSSLAVTAAYLGAWSAVSPPEVGIASSGGTEWLECQSDRAWSMPPVAVESFFIAWGVYLCVKTRNNPSAFNESRYIALSLYQMAVMAAILVPLSMVTNSNPDAPFLLQALGLVIVSAAVAGLMFVPKFYAIAYNVEAAWDTTNNNNTAPHRAATGSAAKGGRGGGNRTKDSLQSLAANIPDPAALAGNDTAHDSLQSMAERMAAADRMRAAQMEKPDVEGAGHAKQQDSLEMTAMGGGGGGGSGGGTAAAGPVYGDGLNDEEEDGGDGANFLGDAATRSHENIVSLEAGTRRSSQKQM